MTIEERLRSTLHAAGHAINLEPASSLEPSQKVGRRWRRSPMAFAVGFVSVVAVGLVVVVLLRPSGSDPFAGSSGLPASPALLDVNDPGLLSWSTLDGVPDNVAIRAVADGPVGWLLVAPRNDQTNGWADAFVLRSNDAATWEEHQTAGFDAVVHIDGLVGTETQYIAYGLFASSSYTFITRDEPSNFPEPAVWTSLDGTDWELTPLPIPPAGDAISNNVSYRIVGVAADGEIAVAAGIEFDEDLPQEAREGEESGDYLVPTRQVFWQKSSSQPWELVDAPEVGTVTRIVAGPAGLVAAAEAESDTGVWLWDSADARWGRISDLPGSIRGLAASTKGYLALIDGQMWYSQDAIQWTITGGSISPSFIEAGEGGFVAATGRTVGQNEAGISWSPDGQRWRQIGTRGQINQLASLEVSHAAVDTIAVAIVTSDSMFRNVTYVGTTR